MQSLKSLKLENLRLIASLVECRLPWVGDSKSQDNFLPKGVHTLLGPTPQKKKRDKRNLASNDNALHHPMIKDNFQIVFQCLSISKYNCLFLYSCRHAFLAMLKEEPLCFIQQLGQFLIPFSIFIHLFFSHMLFR